MMIAALLAACLQDSPRYEFEVTIDDPASELVHVVARYSGLPADADRLFFALPESFAFVGLDEPLLDADPSARANGASVELTRESPFVWSVPASSELELKLDVPLEHRVQPRVIAENDEYEFPYLDHDHGLLVSGALFPMPAKVLAGEVAHVSFHLPEEWEVRAPWPIAAGGFAPTRAALGQDFVAVGAWDAERVEVDGSVIDVLYAPGQDALRDATGELIARVLEAEHALFSDAPHERYLFVFGRPDTPGYGGSPKTGSMTLSVAPSFVRYSESFVGHLVAHEYLHTFWSPKIPIEGTLRFFQEGFVDYYAHLVSARLGCTTPGAFVGTLEQAFGSLESNPLFATTGLSAAGGPLFFKDRNAYDLVYRGGLLVAAWFDRAIREAGEGRTLDDLIRELYAHPEHALVKSEPNLAKFLSYLGSWVDDAKAAPLFAWVRGELPFEARQAFASIGVEVERVVEPFEKSLRANLDGTRLVDLDPNGLASALGLQANDVVIEVGGVPVSDGSALRSTIAQLDGERVQLAVERAGERLVIDCAHPNRVRITLDPAPWLEHLEP